MKNKVNKQIRNKVNHVYHSAFSCYLCIFMCIQCLPSRLIIPIFIVGENAFKELPLSLLFKVMTFIVVFLVCLCMCASCLFWRSLLIPVFACLHWRSFNFIFIFGGTDFPYSFTYLFIIFGEVLTFLDFREHCSSLILGRHWRSLIILALTFLKFFALTFLIFLHCRSFCFFFLSTFFNFASTFFLLCRRSSFLLTFLIFFLADLY